jgi:hypothetical protein
MVSWVGFGGAASGVQPEETLLASHIAVAFSAPNLRRGLSLPGESGRRHANACLQGRQELCSGSCCMWSEPG